jgi:hypothetical protein
MLDRMSPLRYKVVVYRPVPQGDTAHDPEPAELPFLGPAREGGSARVRAQNIGAGGVVRKRTAAVTPPEPSSRPTAHRQCRSGTTCTSRAA